MIDRILDLLDRILDLLDDLSEWVAAFILGALVAWLFMLSLGAAHSHDEVVPNLSFFGSLWVVAALSFVGMISRAGDRK